MNQFKQLIETWNVNLSKKIINNLFFGGGVIPLVYSAGVLGI